MTCQGRTRRWSSHLGEGPRCFRCGECLHANVDHVGPDVNRFGPYAQQAVEHFVCLDCGAWLSLGPSNDAIPQRELMLAEDIQTTFRLWEDGASRSLMVIQSVEFWSQQ